MNITWIIGNGFDLNLGLETGYSTFRDNLYLSSSFKSSKRDRLVEKLEGANRYGLDTVELWSDLEVLLGKVTALYGQDEFDFFSETFEEMEQCFCDYVRSQELRFPEELPTECVDEFISSVTRFDKRMAWQDGQQFSISNIEGTVNHNFVSLNYTQTLKRFIELAHNSNGAMLKHIVNGREYRDVLNNPFYAHGTFDDEGNVKDIVFGVDSPNQIDNDAYAQNSLFVECWVKNSRNTDLFANNNELKLRELIGGADIICIYGCSMGETDARIWRLVGSRLINSERSKLVMFVHQLPDRHGTSHRQYQQMRESQRIAFQEVSGLKEDAMSKLKDRIFFVPSTDYFRMGGTIGLGDFS